MRKAIVLGVAVLAACTAHRTENGGILINPVSDVIGNWSSTLSQVENSGITGEAKVESRAAEAKIDVHVMGAKEGSILPWHVHRGTCSNDKGIVGGADSYKNLHIGSDGMAHGEETIKVGLNEHESYFVNIHKSPTDMSTIVACGPLIH